MKLLLAVLLAVGCHKTPMHSTVAQDERFFTSCTAVSIDAKTRAQTFICHAKDGHDYTVVITP